MKCNPIWKGAELKYEEAARAKLSRALWKGLFIWHRSKISHLMYLECLLRCDDKLLYATVRLRLKKSHDVTSSVVNLKKAWQADPNHHTISAQTEKLLKFTIFQNSSLN